MSTAIAIIAAGFLVFWGLFWIGVVIAVKLTDIDATVRRAQDKGMG